MLVKGAGDQLLARAALAGHEHRRVAVGDARDQIEEPLHRRALAEERTEAARLGDRAAERRDLLAELSLLHRARDDEREQLGLDGLGDEVVRAGADGPDGGVEARVGRDDDDEDVGADREDPLAKLGAVEGRHPEIGEDQVEVVGGDELERVPPRRARLDVEAVTAEHQREQLAHRLIIVHDEHTTTHEPTSLHVRARGRSSPVQPSQRVDTRSRITPEGRASGRPMPRNLRPSLRLRRF